MTITQVLQVFGAISPFLLAIQAYVLKKMEDRRKKDLDERDRNREQKDVERMNLVIGRIEALEIAMRDNTKKLDFHVSDDNFRKGYKKELNILNAQIVKDRYLDSGYKNILTHFSELLEKFGLEYYYSVERTEKYSAREKYLIKRKNVLIATLKAYISNIIPAYKQDERGNKIDFNRLLTDTNCYNPLEILIIDLARNGLSDSDFTDKFQCCMDKFTDLFIAASIVWDKLENLKLKDIA